MDPLFFLIVKLVVSVVAYLSLGTALLIITHKLDPDNELMPYETDDIVITISLWPVLLVMTIIWLVMTIIWMCLYTISWPFVKLVKWATTKES